MRLVTNQPITLCGTVRIGDMESSFEWDSFVFPNMQGKSKAKITATIEHMSDVLGHLVAQQIADVMYGVVEAEDEIDKSGVSDAR